MIVYSPFFFLLLYTLSLLFFLSFTLHDLSFHFLYFSSKAPPVSPPVPSTASSSHIIGTRLPPNALKYFLRHLHNQLCRNDPEGVFGEPVTDEIAPGYSAIIKQPMDLQTMMNKVELNEYPSVNEFKVMDKCVIK